MEDKTGKKTLSEEAYRFLLELWARERGLVITDIKFVEPQEEQETA
ncbi:MAG: hypothetical protein LUE22_01505 [Oscillospiraceae bacterium]|nr:hypothetical protein [Oscillospiraceae bacterium]